MKTMLSTPSTISIAVSVSRAIHGFASAVGCMGRGYTTADVADCA